MAVTSVVEKRLGALPVAAEFLRRLDLAGTVDEVCPGGASAHLTHGQVIEAMVANRLTSPAPLVRVGDWARTWAVEEVLGIEPELLNDDRLARALDAIAPKQVQAGLAVSGDGSIPVHSRVFGGGAAEVSQVVGAMKDLWKMAGEQEFLLVADSKLVSYANVGALLAAQVPFIAPVPAAQVKDGFYAALDLDAATVVDWVPEWDAGKDPADREVYRVLEDVHEMAGPRKRDPVLSVRRVLVHSTGNAKGQRAARDKRLTRAAQDLEKVRKGAGGRYYNTAEKITARLGVIAKTRRIPAWPCPEGDDPLFDARGKGQTPVGSSSASGAGAWFRRGMASSYGASLWP